MQPGLANTQPHSMRNLLQRSYVEYLSIGAAVLESIAISVFVIIG